MASILTPEEICQLDTFTLEEKIEELQSHPNHSYFTEILTMAKLELIDRLQTEEFGRKLANDQFKIVQELDFLPTKPALQSLKQSWKPPLNSITKRQGLIKIQNNFPSSGSFVKVGKPAVQHHYKPKIIKVETIDATKKFLRAKGRNTSKAKSNKVQIPKQILPKKLDCIIQKQQEEKPLIKEQKQILIQTKSQQLSLKQRLKRQIQKIDVIFRENDAYDDLKQIKVAPQNLIDQEIKFKEQQPIKTQIDQPQSIQLQTDGDLQISIVSKQINQSPKIQQQFHKNIISHEVSLVNEQIRQVGENEPQTKQQAQNKNYIVSDLDFEKVISPIKQSKQQKSNSVRAFSKGPYQNILTDYTKDQCKIIEIKLKEEVKGRPEHRMTKSNFGSFRPLIPKIEIYPYHEIIPSFQRLFPHSKNLLLTLRNVEQSLKLHFSKQIDQKSKQNQFLRLNQNDIIFKVVSQSDKARKYSDYFGIDLESFHRRGELMLHRAREDYEIKASEIMLYRVVRTKEQVYDIINSSFHRTKCWHQLPHGLQLRASWNLLWTWSKPQIDFTDLFYFQKVNHFIGNKQIARKDLLKKNIQNIQKLGGKVRQFFDIIPETYLLPGQNIAFIKKFREAGMKDSLNYWILKPVGLSRGRGIELVNRLEDVVFSEPVVLQRYISNPFLVDGYKFDMRIYVLVTSINPLEAFIYKEGFARLSTQRYSLEVNKKDNKFIHLTNFSINRENISDKKLSPEQQLGGCKISLQMLQKRLEEAGIQWQRISKQIQEIIIKSLVACMNVIPQNPNCFQLFGYDIFLDADLKCWLLQVNSSPSLEKEFMLDEIIKQQLVDDIMEIVSPLSYDRHRLFEIVERRRKEAQGLKSSINVSTNSVWQLDEDLHYILKGQKLKKYGEISHKNFKILAPSQRYYSIIKVLQQYKINPIIKDQK